jgi:hypothetical protein
MLFDRCYLQLRHAAADIVAGPDLHEAMYNQSSCECIQMGISLENLSAAVTYGDLSEAGEQDSKGMWRDQFAYCEI